MFTMEVNLYNLEGKQVRRVKLPSIFETKPRSDLVMRALLSEQSRNYQPKGHSPLAGMQTTAAYIGRMGAYRTGRHMGIAIRPRQKLGGGAMGDVRRIPSSVKGRRAHPHTTEKKLVEEMNIKEYRLALASAIAGGAGENVKKVHAFEGELPIVVEDSIENVSKTKELLSILKKLNLSKDLELSHKPRIAKGHRRSSRLRHFRNSILIIVGKKEKIERAGRNIPGVDVCGVNELSMQNLAPGGMPRPSLWSESALNGVEKAVEEIKSIRARR